LAKNILGTAVSLLAKGNPYRSIYILNELATKSNEEFLQVGHESTTKVKRDSLIQLDII